jgi:hypothetical protein
MGEPVMRINRSVGCDKGLPHHLTAKDALPAILRAAATEQIVFQSLKVESR